MISALTVENYCHQISVQRNMVWCMGKQWHWQALASMIWFSVATSKGTRVQFIFGDSLSDVGNNKYLGRSLAQASLPWYGIDFGNGLPNGRFTNGRTVADIIGDAIGLPRPLAYLDPTLGEREMMEHGVNYASGGGGILNETGDYFIQRFSLGKQIELLGGTQRLITNKIGREGSRKFFEESSYVVALGSNDFINNYLMPVKPDSWKYTDHSFIAYLMKTLATHLSTLHRLGARRVVVYGLGPIGCIPLQRVLTNDGGCQDRTNKLALAFNHASAKLVAYLSSQLANSSFKFGDAYQVVQDVIANPVAYGFNNSYSPCCSFGKVRPSITCIPASTLCGDRSKYVFWDEYHPTDRANELIANELIKKFGFLSANMSQPPPPPLPPPPPAAKEEAQLPLMY